MEILVGAMLERDYFGKSPFESMLEMILEPVEVHGRKLDVCGCARCVNILSSASQQKKDPSLRSLFLHLSGNRLMPQYLGKAVLFHCCRSYLQRPPRAPANSKLPGKDGTLGSGGGHGPDGVVGSMSGFQSPRCNQGFSMVLSDSFIGSPDVNLSILDDDQGEGVCAECDAGGDCIENGKFGRFWFCPHCTIQFCFTCVIQVLRSLWSKLSISCRIWQAAQFSSCRRSLLLIRPKLTASCIKPYLLTFYGREQRPA